MVCGPTTEVQLLEDQNILRQYRGKSIENLVSLHRRILRRRWESNAASEEAEGWSPEATLHVHHLFLSGFATRATTLVDSKDARYWVRVATT